MAVYFAQAGGYVKIGYSADPIARVATVTTAGKRPEDLPRGAETTLIGWVPGDIYTEMAWHVRFADDRVAGEWFYLNPAMVRDLIWEDPHGVDIRRMSAQATFAAMAHPELTRDDLARAGVRIDAVPIAEAMKTFGASAFGPPSFPGVAA